jgi:hypothetical protein
MRWLLAIGGIMLVAMTWPASLTLAQSGVISGPPQIIKPDAGGPGAVGPGAQRADGVWIAVAAGLDGSGRRVAVGYSGLQRSQFEAEDAAIKQCNRFAQGFACQAPYALSGGCLYIVPGDRPGGSASWGRGATRQAALDECRRGGHNCPANKVLGGCVPRR